MPGEDASSYDSPGVFGDDGKSDRYDEPNCIGLFLTHRQNRTLLQQWLTPAHEVRTISASDLRQPEPVTDIDLLLLDSGAYQRCSDGVEAYKEREPARFCPALLLVEETPRDPHIWKVVDDIVSMPVEQDVLSARIRGLLARRQLSVELAASEAEFRTLFETAPDPVFVLDNQGVVERANAAFAALVGIPATECQGRDISDFDAFDREAIEAMYTASATPMQEQQTTITYRTGDGKIRHAECSANALAHPDETSTERPRQIIVLRDITERIHQAQELSRQVDRLDEFARVLAHELRNPLSIATGWLEQARATGDEAAFERVEHAHERMRNMISELLALARQGSIVGEPSTVPLDRLVTEAWGSVATGEATLETEPDIDTVTITGDVARLTEVFTNLFRNAVEHGRPDVNVTVGLIEQGPDEHIGIYVADDGPGLPEEASEHFFEPGYTTSQTGSGFGLAIVKQIVKAHGWTIRATESEMGGARFEILGPLDTESTPESGTDD